MPRELSGGRCHVTFYDNLSGSDMTLYYHLPTTEERTNYANALVTRRGSTVQVTVGEARIQYGCDIFDGFKEGAFSIPEKGIISSDPQSDKYAANWKELVKLYASDVIDKLAFHVFESPLQTVAVTDKVGGGNPS